METPEVDPLTSNPELIWQCETCYVWFADVDEDHTVNEFEDGLTCNWRPDNAPS